MQLGSCDAVYMSGARIVVVIGPENLPCHHGMQPLPPSALTVNVIQVSRDEQAIETAVFFGTLEPNRQKSSWFWTRRPSQKRL